MLTRGIGPILLLLAAAAHASTLRVPQDFPTIQAAVDAAHDGDTILIAAGQYAEHVHVVALDGLRIRAQGKVVLTGAAGQVGLQFNAGSDDTVEGLTFTGYDTGVVAADCIHFVLRHCRIENSAAIGLNIQGGSSLLVDHCTIDGAVADAVSLLNTKAVALRHCNLLDAGNGVVVNNGDAIEIDHVLIEHMTADGLDLAPNCTDAHIHDSRIVDVQGEGVALSGDASHVERTTIQNVLGNGVLLSPGANHDVLDRVRVVGAQDTGFFLNGSADLLHACVSIDSGGTSFACLGGGQHVLDACLEVGAGASGFAVGSELCAVLRCRALHAAVDGFQTTAVGTTFADDVCVGAGGNGFSVQAGEASLLRDRAAGSGGLDLSVTGPAPTLVDDVFGTVGP